uniref:WD40 domain protein beta Propeller n=1 Tax=Ammonifex degensii TaxID=42838 RepID=A0A7C2EJD6_9THEO
MSIVSKRGTVIGILAVLAAALGLCIAYTLWFLPGVRYSGSPSLTAASAGRVAWVQQGDLWVKDLPDGRAKRLTSTGGVTDPRWSPTGKWLAFRRGRELWLAGSGGEGLHRVAGRAAAFAWSPVRDLLSCTTPENELFLLSPEPKRSRLLVRREPEITLGRIAWSPDGAHIAFERVRRKPGVPDYGSIWSADVAGGRVVEVYSPEQSDFEVVFPRLAGWSPEGGQILFWLGPSSASLEADGLPLYTVNAAGGSAVRCADALVAETGLEPLEDTLLVRPRSFLTESYAYRMALIAGGGRETWANKRLGVFHLQTNKLIFVSSEDQAVADAAFSPGGERLAYSAGPAAGSAGAAEPRALLAGRRIWTVDEERRAPRQLTGDQNYRDEMPAWSADGNHILFARLDRNGGASLWLMQPDGSGLKQVVAGLSPLPDDFWFGYYGDVPWERFYSYWPGLTNTVLIAAAKETPEARKFMAIYPHAKVIVDRSSALAVDFKTGAPVINGGGFLRLRVFIDPSTNRPAGRFIEYRGRVIKENLLNYLEKELLDEARFIYRNAVYGVSFVYPARWRPRHNYDRAGGIPLRYEGKDGFFMVDAMNGEGWLLEEVARNEAFHKLMPYGKNPGLEKVLLYDGPGFYVFPSPDQPPEMKGQACLVMKYPQRVTIGQERYNYFILYADKYHIREIAASLRFL